jgi:hypothetical protein
VAGIGVSVGSAGCALALVVENNIAGIIATDSMTAKTPVRLRRRCVITSPLVWDAWPAEGPEQTLLANLQHWRTLS